MSFFPIVRPIAAQDTRELRQKLLRPHETIHQVLGPWDLRGTSFHLGAFAGVGADGGEELVGVASFILEPRASGGSDAQASAQGREWRLRGMATRSDVQRKGAGRSLIEAGIQEILKRGGALLWCHGRESALGFYERMGFKVASERFSMPHTGPHYVMEKALRAITPRSRRAGA